MNALLAKLGCLYKKLKHIKEIKETVSIISSDAQSKDENIRFTPLKPVSHKSIYFK